MIMCSQEYLTKRITSHRVPQWLEFHLTLRALFDKEQALREILDWEQILVQEYQEMYIHQALEFIEPVLLWTLWFFAFPNNP